MATLNVSISNTEYTQIVASAATVSVPKYCQYIFSTAKPSDTAVGHYIERGQTIPLAALGAGVKLWIKSDSANTSVAIVTLQTDATIQNGTAGGGGGGDATAANQIDGSQKTQLVDSGGTNIGTVGNPIFTSGGGGGSGSAIQSFVLTDDDLVLFISRDNGATPPVFSYFLLQDGSSYTPNGTITAAVNRIYPTNVDGTQLFYYNTGNSNRAIRAVIVGSPTVITNPNFTVPLDISGTITVGGTSQELVASGSDQVNTELNIQNLDAAVNLWINDSGGDASAGVGSFKITPGSFFTTRSDTQITIFSTLTGHEFTAKR